ncbi:histidine kinase [Actinocatenispora sera]|uniref:HAMP domain-containing sensor histidine kinase n=1 Tax=Actinocatenispora sera TaxID=390989 RepID=UPI0033EADC95
MRSGGPVRTLFWRLFAINGLLFAVGTAILAASPATVSSPVLVTELPVLLVGLLLILVATAVLLRLSLAPLGELTSAMRRADLPGGGPRLAEGSGGDLRELVRSFNSMLDRLAAEHDDTAARAVAAQEGERQRISRELHDEIGQSLTVALLSLRRVADRAPDALRPDIAGAQDAVRASLDDVREVAHRLRPGVLSDLGLRSALTALATEFAHSSGLAVERTVDADLPALPDEVELVVFRVAQEALTNVARHARASRAELTCTAVPGSVTLRVADDGRGGEHVAGAGIRGMRERARLIGATLSIEAGPAGGTEVRLVVPVEEG